MKQYPSVRQTVSAQVARPQSTVPTPGAVGVARIENGIGTLSVVFDNSTGTQPKKFILGDASGVYASASGQTLAQPSSADIGPAQLQASFGYSKVMVKGIQYSVSTSASQFSRLLQYVMAERNGNLIPKKINVKMLASASDNTDKIRGILFQEGEQPVIGWNSGLVLEVGPGEIVNWELAISEVQL